MFRKRLLLALLALLGAIAITGCGNSSSEACYPGLLIVNDQEYLLSDDADSIKFTAGEKIGEIQNKVNADVYPKGDFSSNMLEVGEEIYSTNEDNMILLVKREDGGYFSFRERSNL